MITDPEDEEQLEIHRLIPRTATKNTYIVFGNNVQSLLNFLMVEAVEDKIGDFDVYARLPFQNACRSLSNVSRPQL